MKNRLLLNVATLALLLGPISACNNQTSTIVANEKTIKSIKLVSSEGNTDFYLLTYDDGTTINFKTFILNGALVIEVEEDETGFKPTITTSEEGFWIIDGHVTVFSVRGKDGVSIVSIVKTETNGNVDTYTITYSDGNTSQFTVTNGEQGVQGIQGVPGQDGHTPTITISEDGFWVIDGNKTGYKAVAAYILSISKVNSEGNVDIYAIHFSDGNVMYFTVTNGVDGAQGIQGIPGQDGHTPVITISPDGFWVIDGVKTSYKALAVSIVSITKSGTEGNVDTYAIHYSDGSTSYFTVTNGEQGIQGIQGVPGQDGHTPVITISPDGYWEIDGEKTTCRALAVSIVSINKASTNGNVDTYAIHYSDGSVSYFTVTNGTNGVQGIQGVPGQDGHTPVVTISSDGYWMIDGVKTEYKAVAVSIISIAKTSTEGNVDTYTILYSDGTVSYFTVTNGTNGEQGIQGVPGEDGHTPVITISSDGYWEIDGVKTGYKAVAVSIVSIEKTNSQGNIDIYAIHYSDGTVSYFTVTNGTNGEQGIQGVPGEDGHTPVITISNDGFWVIDGVKSYTKAVGQDGISIISITKTGTDGNVDTYTILFSNGTTSYFTVTNGTQGEPGKTPYIGDNGNWWIGDSDTGVAAAYKSEEEIENDKDYTLEEFQHAIDYSKPTRISTNQEIRLRNNQLTLHYNSTLTIEYGSIVKSMYEYTYEKLNEIITGDEELISVVSDTLYTEGAKAYDGVEWINRADQTTTLSGATLSTDYAELTLNKNVITGTVNQEKISAFFGTNYNISNVTFTLKVYKGQLANLTLRYETALDSINDTADVVSNTSFDYSSYSIIIPH